MFCGKERHNLKRGMMPATSPSRGARASMRNSEMIQGGAQTFSISDLLVSLQTHAAATLTGGYTQL